MKRLRWASFLVMIGIFALMLSSCGESADAGKLEGGDPSKTLVVYFSCTNHTEKAAQYIAEITGGDLYEITPKEPYTDADLNYSNNSCRANREQNDDSARPEIEGKVENMEKYDVIYLGYPIWWGEEPRIIDTFLESYDFAGKTIIPFCTSGSSGIGASEGNLHDLVGDATWLSGRRFSGSTQKSVVEAWIEEHSIHKVFPKILEPYEYSWLAPQEVVGIHPAAITDGWKEIPSARLWLR